MRKLPIIGVMGSHTQGWGGFAVPVGRLLAEMGCHLLTGAGGGVMTEVAKAFTDVKKRKGVCLGVVPMSEYDGRAPDPKLYPNPYIEVPLLIPLPPKALNDSMPYSRNLLNIMTSHALIILPGEHGTQNEVSLALQYNKPLVLFGEDKNFEKFPSAPTRTKDIKDVRAFLETIILPTQKDA